MSDDLKTIMDEVEEDMEMSDEQKEAVAVFKSRTLRKVGELFDSE